jgi:hypothetical protein
MPLQNAKDKEELEEASEDEEDQPLQGSFAQWKAAGVIPLRPEGKQVTPLLKYRYRNKRCGLVSEEEPEHPDIATLSWFNRVWRQDKILRKLIPRAWMPFAKCTLCVSHRRKQDSVATDSEREKLAKEIQDHINEVMREKDLYYDNRRRARKHPRKYLSLIIDGADMKAHEIPHFAEISKLTSEAKRLKLHLYGALAHGHGAFFTTCPDHEAQGNNVTIHMIWDVINKVHKKKGYLPKVLLLQLDNTTKQNKGKYLFGFLGLLVAMGVFTKVLLGFLPVGHTHEDIDQAFSRLSVYLRMNNAFTRKAIGEAVRKSYTFENEEPDVSHWDTVANLRDFLEDYLTYDDEVQSVTMGLVQYRHFRFSMHEGVPVVQCRPKMVIADDDGWHGLKLFTNKTFLFPSEMGVPDVCAAFKNDELPAGLKRESPDHAALESMRIKLFPSLLQYFPYVHIHSQTGTTNV